MEGLGREARRFGFYCGAIIGQMGLQNREGMASAESKRRQSATQRRPRRQVFYFTVGPAIKLSCLR